jgi:hypothetical protein
MKAYLVTTILLVAILAGPVQAGSGAVKVDFDPDVGWVVLNVTATGRLIATAHVQDGLPNEEFSVALRVRYEDGTVDIFADVATLTTNAQGKGNVQVQVDVDPPEGSTTLRRVAVRVRRAPDPLYLAVAWDLPLK